MRVPEWGVTKVSEECDGPELKMEARGAMEELEELAEAVAARGAIVKPEELTEGVTEIQQREQQLGLTMRQVAYVGVSVKSVRFGVGFQDDSSDKVRVGVFGASSPDKGPSREIAVRFGVGFQDVCDVLG